MVVLEIMMLELSLALKMNYMSTLVQLVMSAMLFLGFGETISGQAHLYQNEISMAVLFCTFIIVVLDDDRESFSTIGIRTLSHAWITYPCMIGYNMSSNVGFIVSMLNIVWFADAGAYFAGRWFGRTKLLEAISPSKTFEGTLGALVVAQVVGVVASKYVPSVSSSHWIVISFIASSLGQIGDLFESYFKRSLELKDSGGIMPGHGGFLDRFDAVLFALVFVDLYVRLLGLNLYH